MDSLGLAETAYEVAAKMSVRSTFKDLARERLVVLKRLIALSKTTDVDSGEDGAAEKKAEAALKIAELYYFSRKEVDEARDHYRGVVSEYPETSIAPRAAYGLAWLGLREEPFDSLGAYDAFRDVVRDYPASSQARSAIDVLGTAERDTVGLAALLIEPEPEPEAVEVEPEGANESATRPEIPANANRFDAQRELAADSDSLLGVSVLGDSLQFQSRGTEIISSAMDSTIAVAADSVAVAADSLSVLPVESALPRKMDRKDVP